MDNVIAKGRILSVTQIEVAGLPQSPSGIQIGTQNIQIVNISGQLSGLVITVNVSGQAVKMSGESVRISGQMVRISGESVRISGESVRISGESIRLQPLFMATMHSNTQNGNVQILSDPLTPNQVATLYRIQCAFGAAGQFSAVVSNNIVGGTYPAQIVTFNNVTNLTSGALNIFDMLVMSGDLVNFQYSVSSEIKNIRIQEVQGGTQ